MALPTPILRSVACNVIVDNSIIDEARTHLEFLGYAAEVSGECLFCSHPACFSWVLRDLRGGLLFHKAFGSTDTGRANSAAVVALANRLNADSVLLRAYVDHRGDLAIEAWYPNLYERRSFGLFVTALERELRELLGRCREEVSTLLA